MLEISGYSKKHRLYTYSLEHLMSGTTFIKVQPLILSGTKESYIAHCKRYYPPSFCMQSDNKRSKEGELCCISIEKSYTNIKTTSSFINK